MREATSLELELGEWRSSAHVVSKASRASSRGETCLWVRRRSGQRPQSPSL